MNLAPGLLEVLRCPQCKCRVTLVAESALLGCSHCRVGYRIDDGLPVMIIAEAIPWEGPGTVASPRQV